MTTKQRSYQRILKSVANKLGLFVPIRFQHFHENLNFPQNRSHVTFHSRTITGPHGSKNLQQRPEKHAWRGEPCNRSKTTASDLIKG